METAIIVMGAMISFIAGRLVRDYFIKKKKQEKEASDTPPDPS